MATTKKLDSKPKAEKQKSTELAHDFVEPHDPSGQPGHKKMNLKTEYGKATAENERSKNVSAHEAVARGETIRQKESPQRRIPGHGK